MVGIKIKDCNFEIKIVRGNVGANREIIEYTEARSVVELSMMFSASEIDSRGRLPCDQ